jgi:hypothetical protein
MPGREHASAAYRRLFNDRPDPETPGTAAGDAVPPQGQPEPESDSSGRWAKLQTYAVQLVTANTPSKQGVQYTGRFIPYGAILPDSDFQPGRIVILYQTKVEGRDVVARAVIEGSNLQPIVDHLSEGRRISIKVNVQKDAIGRPVYPEKPNEPVVEQISFDLIPEPEEGPAEA